MAWKITTVEVAASATSVHSTAGDYDQIRITADHASATIKGAVDSSSTATATADLFTGAASVPQSVDNYPYFQCAADSGGTRTFTFAELVKDPS